MRIYVASSWRNAAQPSVVAALRTAGHEVYDFRNPAPDNKGFAWSDIDPAWQSWTPEQFRTALGHTTALKGFDFDMAALRTCDACVLVQPCGRSAHLELGYAVGARKRTVVLLAPGEPELMLSMADHVCTTMDDVLSTLSSYEAYQRLLAWHGHHRSGSIAAPGPATSPPPAPPVEKYSGTDDQKRELARPVKAIEPQADKSRLKAVSDAAMGTAMPQLAARVSELCKPAPSGGTVSDDAAALARQADQLRGVLAITDWVRTLDRVIEAHALRGTDVLALYRRALVRCQLSAEFGALEVLLKSLAEDAALMRQLGITANELGELQREHQEALAAAARR